VQPFRKFPAFLRNLKVHHRVHTRALHRVELIKYGGRKFLMLVIKY
jgi:hypothetical protein